jgi:hypothetical protein
MAGIIPPFGFKFGMRKMVLGKRKDSSRKGPLEVLCIYFYMGQKKNKKNPQNDKTLFSHA